MSCLINDREIDQALQRNHDPAPSRVNEILAKARSLEGLSLDEAAALLHWQGETGELFHAAQEVKERIYGNRIVLFAPLYLSNGCINGCLYCGFRAENRSIRRTKLSREQIRDEVLALVAQGHKRLLLVAGEVPSSLFFVTYLEEAIRTIYECGHDSGAIRRVNVNVAPLSVELFRRLRATGIGTYQLFQETYHRKTYHQVHPSGPKADFDNRLDAMDRAQQAGIDDIGIGALFGLYDYRFEVLGLLSHSFHLQQRFGVGPHTISVPRLRPAAGTSFAAQTPHQVSEEQFRKVVAVLRLAVPYTGLILSTREPAAFRDEVLSLGVSQISAGSRTEPGSYARTPRGAGRSGQFDLEDNRPQLQVVKDMLKQGFFPSFCTSCYRVGRTGEKFMDLAKPGDIKDFCLPNCLLTFKEYVLDYGDEELRCESERVIAQGLARIKKAGIRRAVEERMRRLENGERDLYL